MALWGIEVRRPDKKAWQERWQNYCRNCGGVGKDTKHAPCEQCLALGKCPRCAAQDTIVDGECSVCHWDGSDTAYQMYQCSFSGCHNGAHGQPGWWVALSQHANLYDTRTCYRDARVAGESKPPVRAVKGRRPNRLEDKKCEGCGKMFHPKRSKQKYHNQKCSSVDRGKKLKGKPRPDLKKKKAAIAA